MLTGLGSARGLASGKKGAFYNTLEEFSKYWSRIDIICPQVPRSSRSPASGTSGMILFGNVFLHISPWPLIFHPFWFLKKAFQILRADHRGLKTDGYFMTVHDFPPFYNGIAARILHALAKIPYILEIFHIPGYPRSANFREAAYRFLFKIFIKFDASKAKAVRVMNNQVADFLIEAGVPEKRIIHIPAIYVDLDIFRPMNTPKEYDIIFIGRLEKNKGAELLLEAIRFLIFSLRFPVKCLIVGDGPLANGLKLKTINYKLETSVYFHGWAKDSRGISELINRSEVLIMPSYNEGGPRVVAEAMACGVPVLATPVGIVPEVVKDGESGKIIDWDPEDIAKKAKELLESKEDKEKFSRAGLENARRFDKKETIMFYAEKIKDAALRT